MKSILFFILLTPTFLFAQDVNFKWVKQMVGSGDVEASTAMVVDKWGNVITTGHFSSTVDFDPGPGVYNLSGPYNDWDHSLEDMFVSKLDAAGNFIWVKHIAGRIGVSSITLDAAGNIYTVGRFQGPVDFDPGPCKYELTTLSDATDIFVLKLNPEGGFIWVKEMNAANNSYGFANCIAIDSTGNSYTTGRFHGSVDFDPGIGIYELVEPGVFSQYWYPYSMFIFKLDPDGSFVWAKQMKGTGEHYYSDAASLAFIGSGNLLTTGNFSGTVDFDSGPGTYNLTSPRDGNAFISRLDVNGNFIWVKRIAGDDTSGSWATSIKVDKSLNIITTGGFWGTNDFDPGLGVFNLTSTYKGRNNMFISKLDSVGNFIWAKGIGGTSDYNNPSGGASGGVYCTSMDLDSSGDIYSAGYFQETVDFDPGPGVYSLTNVPDLSNAIWPGFDMFISKSDSDGNFLWAKQMRTTALTYTRQTYCSSIEIDDYGNIYTSGGFLGATDFDPGSGSYNLSAPWGDIFIHKMTPCTGSTSAIVNATSCKNYSLNGHTYTSSGTFIQTILNKTGCDSIITLNLTIIRVDTTINVTACNSYTHCRSYDNCTVCYTHNSSSVYTDTLTTVNGCDSVVHVNIIIKPNSVTSFNAVACNSYSWNGQTYTSSGLYIDTLVAANGCDSIIMLNLTINAVTISAQPQSVNLCAGNDHTFSVTTPGGLAYQWQLSIDGGITFNDIAGATNSSYSLTSVTTQQNGYQYRCIVSNTCDSLTSSVAELLVIDPVSLVSQPANTEICSGGNTNFSVSGTSTQVISYQWEVSTDGGTNYFIVLNGGTYSGTTTSVLAITGADASLNNNRYRCRLSNATCGNATVSNAATLTVRRLPSIALAAIPITSLFPWQTTTLTARSAGTGGALSFNWYYNNMVVTNTGNSRRVNLNQLGNYQVQVSERWPSDLVCTNRSAIVAISANDTAKLIIYPNPNYGQFRISYYNPSGVHDLQVITIYDSKGAMVYRKRLTPAGIYTVVDISMIPGTSGFYSVIVSNENGKRLAIGKVIVQ